MLEAAGVSYISEGESVANILCVVDAIVDGELIATGRGNSEKAARREAAIAALAIIEAEQEKEREACQQISPL